MFKALRFSLKKSKLISKIAKESVLGNNTNYLIDNLINEKLNQKEIYIEELLKLLSEDKFTLELLKKYNRSFIDLKEIINVLEINGAGQIVRGHYVPVSAISFIDSLEIILMYWTGENFKVKDFDNYNSNLFIANKMISHFK